MSRWCVLLLLLPVMVRSSVVFDKWLQLKDEVQQNGIKGLLKSIDSKANKVDSSLMWQKMRRLEVGSFSWSSCGSSSDTGHITSLSVSPDPLSIPGNITVSFEGSLSTDITAPLEVNLEIEKKILFWVTIPCIDNIGSCDYTDACPMLDHFPCPPEWQQYHINCRCPVKAGNYKVPPSTISVQPFGIPSWLESGDYKVKATVTQGGKQVTCLQIGLTLK